VKRRKGAFGAVCHAAAVNEREIPAKCGLRRNQPASRSL